MVHEAYLAHGDWGARTVAPTFGGSNRHEQLSPLRWLKCPNKAGGAGITIVMWLVERVFP